jgi:hypothetical protein
MPSAEPRSGQYRRAADSGGTGAGPAGRSPARRRAAGVGHHRRPPLEHAGGHRSLRATTTARWRPRAGPMPAPARSRYRPSGPCAAAAVSMSAASLTARGAVAPTSNCLVEGTWWLFLRLERGGCGDTRRSAASPATRRRQSPGSRCRPWARRRTWRRRSPSSRWVHAGHPHGDPDLPRARVGSGASAHSRTSGPP